MKQARVSDDGTTVELDLHGVYVDEAIALVEKAAAVASERGRSTLRVIHGSSSSDPLSRNRTIKHALEDVLAGGIEGVISHHSMGDVTLLNLSGAARRDSALITLFTLS